VEIGGIRISHLQELADLLSDTETPLHEDGGDGWTWIFALCPHVYFLEGE
jgi:hypothetical protein